MPVTRRGAITGATQMGHDLAYYATKGVLAVLAARANVIVPPLTEVSKAKPIPAILDADRWCAECPDCLMTAAYVWPDEPLFMCAYCWNVEVAGLWRRVKMPAPATRTAIERIVGLRKLPHQRNWRGETVTSLRVENKANGVPGDVQ